MSKALIYARNLAANWIGHGANLVVMLFLSPFVVHTLGQVEYGIWSLLTVITGYMGILDLGIRSSTGRYIILYLGRGEHDKIDQTIRTSLGFFSVIGILIVGAGVGLGWAFPNVFKDVPQEYGSLVKLLLPLLAFNMWISMARVVFSSVLAAHDRFDLSNSVNLIMLAIRTVGTILALSWGYGIMGLTLVVILCNLVGLLGNWFIARRIYARLKVWPLMFNRQRLRELFGYGIFAFITAIAVKIIGQTDLVIVGITFDVATVTVYSVGAMLIYYSSTFIIHISGTFFPPVQRAVARGEMGSAKWLLFRQVRLALIFGLPMSVGFIFFAKPFITLWMFEPKKFPMESVQQASLVMIILAASKLPPLLVVGAKPMLAAMGHVRATAIISIAEAFLNLALSLLFVLVFGWGLAGIALGTLIGSILVRFLVTLWYTCRKTGLNPLKLIVEIGGRAVIAMGLFGGLCYILLMVKPTTTWIVFGIQVSVVLMGYLPIAMWVLLPANDRKRIWQRLRQKGRRRQKEE